MILSMFSTALAKTKESSGGFVAKQQNLNFVLNNVHSDGLLFSKLISCVSITHGVRVTVQWIVHTQSRTSLVVVQLLKARGHVP